MTPRDSDLPESAAMKLSAKIITAVISTGPIFRAKRASEAARRMSVSVATRSPNTEA